MQTKNISLIFKDETAVKCVGELIQPENINRLYVLLDEGVVMTVNWDVLNCTISSPVEGI